MSYDSRTRHPAGNQQAASQKVAIIGMACLFPGAATPEAFWQNLTHGIKSTSPATQSEFSVDPAIFYDPSKTRLDTTYFAQGGFVKDVEISDIPAGFDNPFAWSLYVARESLKDSGYLGNADVLDRTGLILGNLSFPTRFSHLLSSAIYDDAVENAIRELTENPTFQLSRLPEPAQIDLRNAMISGQPASFVANLLGLGKTHFAIDAACASSLYAIGLACEYLQSGRADMMLAGAVNGADPLFVNMGFNHFGAYPDRPDDSRPLDSSTQGLIAGEGAGMFVLKRLADAQRDGDTIHAVIAGIGMSNDGRGKHPLTPNPRGQILALRRAYTDVSPADVQYVECHASGTPVGDKTEINSMAEFFSEYNVTPLIGSVKSNVGHLLTTAGAASVLKVILSLKHGVIPATLGVQQPMTSQTGYFGDAQVVAQNSPYPAAPVKRAGVNAFGFGGVSAHMVLEPPPAQTAAPLAQDDVSLTHRKPQQRMAIVGMGAQFADINNIEDLTRTIYDGKQHFREIPPQRWKGLVEGAPHGAYMDAFQIDFMRYKLPPKDDEQPIPQQLLLLKVADNALRDADLQDSTNVAVIVAIGTELSLHQFRGRLDLSWQIREGLARAGIELTAAQVDYLERISKDALNTPAQVNQYTSFIGNIISSRVAALWNFSGPAFTISSDENSAFKALEMAQLLLDDPEIDAVVVGAVDLAGGVENIVIRSQIVPVNSGKETLSFDEASDGWLIGEGAGAVVLKRAGDAANKRVYAYIDAVSVVESSDLQAGTVTHAANDALQIAGLSPQDIGYVEANASGMPWEDDAEVKGLHAVYASSDANITALGSVKANIGNTFAASGIASLIKTALTVYHRFIPAVPAWNKPENLEAWQNSPFYVAAESKTWFAPTGVPRRAAISGLGMDGAAVHVILSEGDHNTDPVLLKHQPLQLILVDADSRASMMGRLGQLETALKEGTDVATLAARAFLVFSRRQYTLALIVRDAETLQKEIDAARKGVPNAFDTGEEWQTPAGSYFTPQPVGGQGKIAFVYPGAFNSYPGVGKDLLTLFPSAHDHLLTLTKNTSNAIADELLYQRSLAAPTRAEIRAFRSGIQEDQIAMMQSGTTFAVLFTNVVQKTFKIKPDAALGYSIGEGSMMWAMGVWRDGDPAQERFGKSPLFRTRLYGRKDAVREHWGLPADAPDDFWASYVVAAPVAAVESAAAQEARVYVTHINTPQEVVIAGEPVACERVIAALTEQFPGLLSVKAPFDAVIHNEAMASEFDEFFHVHDNQLASPLPDVTFYSAADYAPVVITQHAVADNITRVTVKQVDFPRLVQRAYDDGVRVFIELGPGSTCTRWINDTLDNVPHIAVAIDNLRSDEHTAIVKMLARLVSHHVPMDLHSLYKDAKTGDGSRTILRRITLGGTRIEDMILSDEARRTFADLANQKEIPRIQEMPEAHEASAPAPHATVNEQHQTVEQFAEQPETVASAATSQPGASTMVTMTTSKDSNIMQQRLQELRQLGDSIRAQMGSTPAASTQAATAVPVRPTVPLPPERFEPSAPIFTTWQIDQFARGSIKACFGDEYAIYDDVRAPRIPNTDLMFVSRAIQIDATRLQTKVGSSLVMEYDVPNNIWYYRDNPYPFTPYSVLMEMALQPCGFLSAYMGPTFDFPNIDFYFRNLDGHGKLTENVDLRGRTLTNRVELLSSTTLQGIIIQKYSFNMMLDGKSFYTGESTFGYFTMQALSSQAGLDMGKPPVRWHVANPDVPMQTVQGSRQKPALMRSLFELPDGILAFVDDALVNLQGGKAGKGYIYAHNIVNPSDWYFRCHFHQDPVMPGSLGLETVSQAVQLFAIEAGLGAEFKQPYFNNVEDSTMIWKYRGQVLGDSRDIHVEVHITDIERIGGKIHVYADASLWKGELRIYEFKRVGVSIQDYE